MRSSPAIDFAAFMQMESPSPKPLRSRQPILKQDVAVLAGALGDLGVVAGLVRLSVGKNSLADAYPRLIAKLIRLSRVI